MNKVDVLLVPYNYVLSPSIRHNVKLDLKDAFIIFDEAHNIENMAESCSSFELSNDDL